MWTAANPIMVEGELGFETDTSMAKLGDGVTAWNDLPYWPPEKAPKVFYDSIGGGSNYYPWTLSQLNNGNQGYAPEVINNWTEFAKGWFQVENYTTHEVSQHRFATPQDLVDWKNANIPNALGSFTELIAVRPFDVVNYTIPVIDRMYGINTLYGGFKAGRYKKANPAIINYDTDWNATFLLTIFDLVMGPSGLALSAFGINGPGRKCFWTPGHFKRMYAMPKAGEIIDSRATPSWTGNRYTWQPAQPPGFQLNPLTPERYSLSVPLIVTAQDNGALHKLYTPGATGESQKEYNRSTLEDCNAAVAVFKATNVNDPGEHALLMKPVGIDRVYLNGWDSSLYDLEVVWEQTDQQKVYRRTINPAEYYPPGNLPHPNNGIGLARISWRFPSHARYQSSMWHPGRANVPITRFRLRDKVTGEVGPLSRAAIKLYFKHTNAPNKYIVE